MLPSSWPQASAEAVTAEFEQARAAVESGGKADREKRDAQKDFPPGTAGTGLQMTAIDLDHDGDLDLICPGKSGLYYFENLGSKK